jgi:tetratricopeptide (TPR) repeat protein
MAIGEHRFYNQQNYRTSLEAYEQVLRYPKSTLYDLALFKTAWCYWKLGDTSKSALRFKEVLDLSKKKAGRSDQEQKRATDLQGQALDYLVELFTEDDSKTAQDAFEFLAQIGGKEYSQKVLAQLANTVFDQTRYERAIEAYRLLITLDPTGVDAPDHHRRIVEANQLMGDIKSAVAEMRKLANSYGTNSAWAKANQDRPKALEHARTMAEELIRTLAKTMHADAQQNEKASRVVDKDRYARAAETYQFYLASFPDATDAVELRYLRADILYFKLQRYDEAGREYVAVGKSQPVGKYHKDALLQAMTAFEKLRKPPSGGKREISDSDRLFGEAADLYAVLFP